MPTLNEEARELNAKIVYWGPALSGKSANLKHLYEHANETKGKFRTLQTERERTLTFSFCPNFPPIRGYELRVHVYAMPGSVFYEESYLETIRGASGVVFVADSQFERLEANLEQIDRLHEQLASLGVHPGAIPMVFQHNKRDLPNVASTKLLDRLLAVGERPSFAACARVGEGVRETFTACLDAVHAELSRAPSIAVYR